MQRKIAAALKTSQNTPRPNNISPVNPENRRPSKIANAVNIHMTNTRL